MISILNFEISLKCKKSTTNKCNCARGKHIIMWHVLVHVLYYITSKVLWKYEKNNIVYAYMQSMNGCYSSIAISTQYDNMFTWTHGTQLYITIYLCTDERVEMLFTVNSQMPFFSLSLASYVYEFFIVILLTWYPIPIFTSVDSVKFVFYMQCIQHSTVHIQGFQPSLVSGQHKIHKLVKKEPSNYY
jgi:hypothetical protein